MKLSLANLHQLGHKADIPTYDRSSLRAGIVHFGVGNFHRAHQALYLDDLFRQGLDHEWAILGAGILPSDEVMRAKLDDQDYLSTVIEEDSNRSAARVIASMIGYLPPDRAEDTIERLSDPAIRIVSLTITEGGYFIDPASGVFNPMHPAIVADSQMPKTPKTVFGLILAGLRRRRDRGMEPFTVMSCDNIVSNGEVTRAAVTGLARLIDPTFAEWVELNVAFPNAMVDRITPATTAREVAIALDEYGISDNCPVFCEEFKQWIIEDHFPSGRPGLEKVGVEFVKDVAPYEHMKLRILNGGHAAIAYPAALLDFEFVHQAMEDLDLRAFLTKLAISEIIPIVPPVPNINLDDYFAKVDRRFSNPKIADTIRRLSQDGSNRQPKFILPTTADRIALGLDVVGLSLVSALWCRYLAGFSDTGKALEVSDVNAKRLVAAALKAKINPCEFIDQSGVFGALAQSDAFRKTFEVNLNFLWSFGTRTALQAYVSGALDKLHSGL